MSKLVGEWTTRPPFLRRITVMRYHSGIPPNRIGISWYQILTPRDRNIAFVSRFLSLRWMTRSTLTCSRLIHSIAVSWDLDMVTQYERILLRLRPFTEENHSAQHESFAGSLRREIAAILRASAIVG
jgi:hypothetical protein